MVTYQEGNINHQHMRAHGENYCRMQISVSGVLYPAIVASYFESTEVALLSSDLLHTILH